MFASLFLVFYILHLTQIGVKCNNLYVHPKNVYATGGKIAVDCMTVHDDHADIASREVNRTRAIHVEWIKLNTLSVISSHPKSRVRRDGYRLLFDSTDYPDEGFYCCSPTAETHAGRIGCSHNSTMRVVIVMDTENVQTAIKSDHGHNVVAKSLSGTNTWTLEARPRTRCVLLGRSASINCLNNTNSFAENIQWFKILSNGGLQLIPRHTSGARISSNAHQLQFTSTVAEDAGLYCCKTFTETECSPTAVANITISLPPTIYHLQNQTVVIGETVEINCNANTTMRESISFSWQKNGKELPDESRYSIISSTNNTTLKITNATKLDQGYFSCIAKNRKYQQDNQSMHLHVQNPLGCNEINTSDSITVGLQSFIKNCSLIEKALLYNVINKFLKSICNCSDYCLTIDDINCSSDDVTITIVMTLKEKQPLFLKNLVYSNLKEGPVNVDQNYSILCVVNTLCEKQTTEPPTTATTMTPSIISNTTTEATDSNTTTETADKNTAINLAIIIAISAVTIVVLIILILLITIAIVLRFQRRKQKEKQISQGTFHVISLHQSANETVTSNNHPTNCCQSAKENVSSPCQSVNENVSSNKHPSTSSDEGYCEGESPRSVSFPTQNIANPINDLQNSNERIPPVPTDINSLYTNKHKTETIKTNYSVLEHHRNVPLDYEIQWKQNETYQDYCINTSKVPSAAPVLDFKPLVTKELKPENYYDDIVGISETTHKAPASHNHHEMKHPQSKLPDMTQYPKTVCNNQFHSNTTSRNVAKSLNIINHNNLPSSQV